jgi:hypothetical protein
MASYTGAAVNVFYVDGENGDDTNSDTQAKTLSTAWKTIDYAFSRIAHADAASPGDGDEIRILRTSNDAAYYSETTTAELDWVTKEISITGAASDGSVDGTRTTIYGTDLGVGENSIWETSVGTADQVTISNLIFDGADAANCHHCIHHSAANSHNMRWVNCRFKQAADHGYDFDGNANYISFINCQFDNNGGAGLYLNASANSLVYRCLFNDNTAQGGYFTSNSRIAQCVFYNNGGDGCRVGSSGALVCGCVFEDNTGDGLYNTGGGTAVVTDCVSTGNGAYGWETANASEAHFFNCHSYGNSSGEKNTPSPTNRIIMHNLGNTSDPGWVSEATHDFTPTGTSAVVSGGLDTPFLYMGTTSSDAGINKFRTSPYQLRAGRPRRY